MACGQLCFERLIFVLQRLHEALGRVLDFGLPLYRLLLDCADPCLGLVLRGLQLALKLFDLRQQPSIVGSWRCACARQALAQRRCFCLRFRQRPQVLLQLSLQRS